MAWNFHLSLASTRKLDRFKCLMDKSSLLKKMFTQKTRDYTYAIAFFFIFSFFVFYVIRPNLLSVFEANTKIEQLKNINKLYEEQIDKVIEVQSVLEANRDDLSYLKEAIALKPEVNKVLADINVSTEGGRLESERIDVSDINLKEKAVSEKLKSFVINMNLKGTFDDVLSYVRTIYNQRRLKLIPQLVFGRSEKESSQSSTLDIKLEVEGYYL